MTHRTHHPASATVTFTVAACLMLWATQSPAQTDHVDHEQTKPLTLRKVMQDLGQNMQLITLAIAKEDWPMVVELAPKVAAHAAPSPDEMARIMEYLGADAAKFRSLDGQTHETAHAMMLAAKNGDGTSVIQSFAHVQESCLNCHQTFRKKIVDHFYGNSGNR